MIEDLVKELGKDNYTTTWWNINYKLIPTSAINAVCGSEEEFNKLYKAIINDDRFVVWPRTLSGGISTSKELLLYESYLYNISVSTNVVEILISLPIDDEQRTYRIQYRSNNYKDKGEKLLTGSQAFNIFKKEVKKDGINLKDYAIDKEEGMKVNEEIQKPDIRLFNDMWQDHIFDNVCHLDFHKFYMSGLKISHPEFAPAIERLAEKAKKKKVFKTVLAATVGYFHSKYCSYKYAKLARDAINTAYKRYYEVMDILRKERLIIATNTDGIWYEGPEWHGIYEGKNLTEWNNDHVNCKIRFKSAGSYEYIENGKYTPVVRGRTILDKVKSRDDWEWGDIYEPDADIQVWTFEEGEGIVWVTL